MGMDLFYSLIETHAEHCRWGRAGFRSLDLTTGQPRVLHLLLHHPGVLQKDLAVMCQIEPPSMTALLYRLEDKGLVSREPTLVSGGKRAFQVFLTPQGKERALQVEQEILELEERCFAGFTPEERTTLLELLDRIKKNLQEK